MTHLVKAVVSLMERRGPAPRVAPPRVGADLVLRDYARIPLDLYRHLYDAVGRPHHWTSRLLPDAALSAQIHAPGMAVFVLEADGRPVGWFELEASRQGRRTRIVHFGIMPEFRGQGFARHLLARAIEAALATGAEVVTLETNSLDHPAALPLYTEAGFVCVDKRFVATPAIED
ncbi:N-acetyltransferase [Aureimonas endophytica]|uniref:N-acetyltransferase n=1 Tax=Aureimonas endophytica TaxID=2027858 RepID=A0A916ZE83_9HYPH|nr:GNAT family N-acetyltransferase [Aureimonas endophytica]GGD91480.1 N-acetyltransferase [Aureimonas endophytica]